MEFCIKDREGRICGWLVGMSDDEIDEFLISHPGTHIDVYREEGEENGRVH